MTLRAALDKPASEVMEDASLAMYLWLRRIPGPRQFVLNLGVRHYQVQFPSDADTASQIREQICQELVDANLDVIITFFRNMLEQPHREDFFEDIYQHILFHMVIEPRPITDIQSCIVSAARTVIGGPGTGPWFSGPATPIAQMDQHVVFSQLGEHESYVGTSFAGIFAGADVDRVIRVRCNNALCRLCESR